MQFIRDLGIEMCLGQQQDRRIMASVGRGFYAKLEKGGLWSSRMYLGFVKKTKTSKKNQKLKQLLICPVSIKKQSSS